MSEPQEEVQTEEKPNAGPTAEDTARESGWKPEDEWTDDDPKRPEKFSSAETFNARGEFIGRMKAQDKRINEMESQFNTRLENTNKLHQAQLDIQKNDLITKRDAAIDLADRETANKHQEELDKINTTTPVQPQNGKSAVVTAWESDNPWINQSSPKTDYANAQLNRYLDRGQSIDAALANLDTDIAREFPALNPNRENQPFSEGGSKPGGKRTTGALTMADLTPEEERIHKLMPGSWKTEAAFLQSVQDARKGS